MDRKNEKYKEIYNKTRVSNPAITLRHIHPIYYLFILSRHFFLLVTSPSMLSPIILHSVGGETFLWFQSILIISIPFLVNPVLDDAIPLALLILDDAFESPPITQTVTFYWSWLR